MFPGNQRQDDNPPESETTDKQEKSKQVIPSVIFCLSVVAVVLLAASVYCRTWNAVMTAVIWMLACFILGTFVGFLFGIPKILQSQASSGDSDKNGENARSYKQLVNTNLTEISDWLTKIIVGLGLVKLTKIPPYIKDLATTLGSGISEPQPSASSSGIAFAYGIIVCGFTVGFLFGYLATRLYLAPEFRKAEQDDVKALLGAASAKIDNLESNQAVLTNKLYPSTTDNPAIISPPQENNAQSNVNQQGPNAPILHNDDAVVPNPEPQPPLTINPLDVLLEQAAEYMSIQSPDYGERVRLKDLAASRMSDFALRYKITKDQIVGLYNTTRNEGLVLALAGVVTIQAEAEDCDRLLNVSFDLRRLHVRYRVVNAILKLLNQKLVKDTQLSRISSLATFFRNGADSSLRSRLDALVAILKIYANN